MIKIVQESINYIFSFVEKRKILLSILCLITILRIPTLYEPNRYADEDIYLTIGQSIRGGMVMYRDIYDNKTPLIYYLAGFAGSVMWFRLILLCWNLASIVFFNSLVRKFINKRILIDMATLLFGLFTTLPLLEGEMANGELFMILPVIIALNLLFDKKGELTSKKSRYFFAGVSWSIGFLFKSPPLVELFGFLFFFMLYKSEDLKTIIKKLFEVNVWALGIGFFLPVLATVMYFYLIGSGEIYLKSALLQNFSYLSSWGGGASTSSSGSLLSGNLTTRALIMIVSLVIAFLFRNKIGNPFGFAFIWSITALFGANLAGRPYPHYLIEIVAPFSLLFILFLSDRRLLKLSFVLGAFGLLILAVIRYDFWYYKSIPYYQNFLSYVFGLKTKDDYYAGFGGGVLRNYKVSNFIAKATSKDDRIFVWGTEPAIYSISRRLPASRYTVAYHVHDFKAYDEVMDEIRKVKPRIVVVMKGESKFSDLIGYLVQYYNLVATYDDASIYQTTGRN